MGGVSQAEESNRIRAPRASETFEPGEVVAFKSDDQLLEAASRMLQARRESGSDDEGATVAQRSTERWHSRFELTGDELVFCARCGAAGLSRLEREIVVALLLDTFGMLGDPIKTCGEVPDVLGIEGIERLEVLRSLTSDGRLCTSRLISFDNPDDDFCDRRIALDPALVEFILHGSGQVGRGWPVKTEEELHQRLGGLTTAFGRKSDVMMFYEPRLPGMSNDLYRISRRIRSLWIGFVTTLEQHSQWKTSKWLSAGPSIRSSDEAMISAILLGKALGHMPADDDLFTGIGLARAVSPAVEEVVYSLSTLGAGSPLVRNSVIQPCGGDDAVLSGDPQDLSDIEFELTDGSLDALGLKRESLRRRSGEVLVREPAIRLDQLALSDQVHSALRMAAAQVLHTDVMMDAWGFKSVLPYGRGVTLLFSGPPGVGKTACAEALAHELGRPILCADYAQIRNCYVGATEKNIAKTFRQAKAHGAVLFWDEADSMLYDRDGARRPHEISAVNLLLQELERFDGVCVLATNRKLSLDSALERRISMKVEFERPDSEMRRRIWERLMPPAMPLARDVDMEALIEPSLTGGEIKNVILNAARRALARDPNGCVCLKDFREALQSEVDGGWSGRSKPGMGFRIRPALSAQNDRREVG